MKTKGNTIKPGEVGRLILGSLERDLLPWAPAPSPEVVSTVARWGRACGLEAQARRSYRAAARLLTRQGDTDGATRASAVAERLGELPEKDVAAWISARVSPWPDRWEALVDRVKTFEAGKLMREAERLHGCGDPWGRVVRLFWKGAKGQEVSKSYGIHRCKSRFCPTCGKAKTRSRSEEMEKVLEIASEWGLGPANVRFLTLTVRNGESIPELRTKAHEAWGKIQRRRWWPRWVCMWFRGSECVTGEDGNWNFHLHVVLVLWAHRVSYHRLWKEWKSAVGEHSHLDIDRLHSEKMRQARRRGGIGEATRYIVKYLAKGEELAKIARGPGGFAHYVSGMKRLRAFACGGAAPVMRRMAGVLLPNWARRMEWIREGVELRSGVAPCRAEEVDTETGEAWDVPAPDPCLSQKERDVANALCAPLLVWDQEGGGTATVGRACGKGGRWRRLGHGPVRSSVRTVGAHEKGEDLDALHQVIAGGDWRIFDEKDHTKDGRVLRYRVVLPGVRFAWRDVGRVLWDRLARDGSEWGRRRRAAFQAAARAGIGTLERLDAMRAAAEGLQRASDDVVPHLRRDKKILEGIRMAPVVDAGQVEAWKSWINHLERGRYLDRGTSTPAPVDPSTLFF